MPIRTIDVLSEKNGSNKIDLNRVPFMVAEGRRNEMNDILVTNETKVLKRIFVKEKPEEIDAVMSERGYLDDVFNNPNIGLENGELVTLDTIKENEIIASFLTPGSSTLRINEEQYGGINFGNDLLPISRDKLLYSPYSMARLIKNESKDANCVLATDGITVIAKRVIEKGEKLALSYPQLPFNESEKDEEERTPIAFNNMKKDFLIESFHSENLDPGFLKEITDLYVEIFINDFPEFAGCLNQNNPDCLKSRVSIKDYLGLDKSEHVDLETFKNIKEMPDCPCCGNKMEPFYDMEAAKKCLSDKFRHQSDITVARDRLSGKLVSLCYGYVASLKDIFRHEWERIYVYIKNPENSPKRDFDKMLDSIIKSGKIEQMRNKELDEETIMYCWNCIISHPKYRGDVFSVVRSFFGSISKENVMNLDVIGETIIGTTAFTLFKSARDAFITGFLNEEGTMNKGDYILISSALKESIEHFPLSFDDLKSSLKGIRRKNVFFNFDDNL